ncbi:MAG: ABC transporter permease [Crocinitomicaceae bacterium]|nr:ABC transporter permease [Crocinitomicaceae bacterium]MBK8927068.1 ABC transporter permease [Crocinitomicaceae bacterium]
MNASFFIAKRYLFSKKTHNAINIISTISVVGIAISTMALVIVLSAFNGLEHFVMEINSAYEQDIRIESVKTKSFSRDYVPPTIYEVDGLVNSTEVIEEIVILKNEEQFIIGLMKGVEPPFIAMSEMEDHLQDGEALLEDEFGELGIIGVGALINLAGYITQQDIPYDVITIYVPNKNEKIKTGSIDGFTTSKISIAGAFAFNNRVDESVLVVPLAFAEEVLNFNNEISAIEMQFEEGTDLESKKLELSALLGKGFKVRTHFEQNQLIYQTSQMEKWLIVLFLTFIFFMVTFTLVSSITMLVLEKRNNLQTIRAMGATKIQLVRIFFYEGLLINFFGLALGLGLGYGICFLQQTFGFVMLDEELQEIFPVYFELTDLILILSITCVLGALVSYLPSKFLIRQVVE